MTTLSDLLDVDRLEMELQDGFVRERRHPWWPELTIFNYTEKTQYEKAWNAVTRQCRGLIVNNVTGEVLARPFDKFFNVGEHQDGIFAPEAQVEVTDKMDGSLGILFPTPEGGLAIATRGSFESEQAIHATETLLGRYPDFRPVPGLTHLFEIVYPENRIVCDYGDLDDLVLLGARDIETGAVVGPDRIVNGNLSAYDRKARWQGPTTEVLPAMTFREAVDLGDRQGKEGIVVRFRASGLMVKVKQEDYVRLHRLVTGLNERVVWEHLATHQGEISGLVEQVPDEFHDWVMKVTDRLREAADSICAAAHVAYQNVLDDLDGLHGEDSWQRRHFAHEAKQHGPLTPLLFHLLDGRDIYPAIWKSLKPKGETPSLMNRTEDNA